MPDGMTDAPLRCPDPTMINTGTFCIDTREVDTNHYLSFTASGFDAGIPECAWKTSYQEPGTTNCGGMGPLPVQGMDWCDAYAYCAWNGKRLCGKLETSAKGGGALDMADIDDPLLDEWFYACTHGGMPSLAYPYGSTFDASACNGLGGPGGGVAVQSGSLATCVGGFPGIFDMSGNVWEWENACDDAGGASTPGGDHCSVRGGSYAQPMDGLKCADIGVGPFQRNVNATGIVCDMGIRCCADLVP